MQGGLSCNARNKAPPPILSETLPRPAALQGAEGGGERNPAEQTPGEFEGLQPGQLSEGLRQALGIGAATGGGEAGMAGVLLVVCVC